jgi:hypothetical protein
MWRDKLTADQSVQSARVRLECLHAMRPGEVDHGNRCGVDTAFDRFMVCPEQPVDFGPVGEDHQPDPPVIAGGVANVVVGLVGHHPVRLKDRRTGLTLGASRATIGDRSDGGDGRGEEDPEQAPSRRLATMSVNTSSRSVKIQGVADVTAPASDGGKTSAITTLGQGMAVVGQHEAVCYALPERYSDHGLRGRDGDNGACDLDFMLVDFFGSSLSARFR